MKYSAFYVSYCLMTVVYYTFNMLVRRRACACACENAHMALAKISHPLVQKLQIYEGA